MADVLDKIERIEVATIQPDDVLFIHVPVDFTSEECNKLNRRFVEAAGGLSNRCIVLSGGIESEIKRPAELPGHLSHG